MQVKARFTLELVITALPGVDKVQEPLSFESVHVAPWTFEVTVIFCELPDIVEAHDVNKINDANNESIFFIDKPYQTFLYHTILY